MPIRLPNLVGFPTLDRVLMDPGTKDSPVIPVPTDGAAHVVTIQLDVADTVWDDPTNADALLDITLLQSRDQGATWYHMFSGNSIPGGSRGGRNGSLPTLSIRVQPGTLVKARLACNKRLRIGITARVE